MSIETSCGRFASKSVPSPATARVPSAAPAALNCKNFRRVGNDDNPALLLCPAHRQRALAGSIVVQKVTAIAYIWKLALD